jgi:pimeloyl-ACP methyl ester carboxylesterase
VINGNDLTLAPTKSRDSLDSRLNPQHYRFSCIASIPVGSTQGHGSPSRPGNRHITVIRRSAWSPRWQFDESTFDQTAISFDNPDFVDVVIHAYRHSFGLAEGEPAYAELEDPLARRPAITVPAVTLDGISDTLKPGGTADSAGMFTARHEHRVIDAGHNLPQEAPAAFADAVLTVRKWLDLSG